jgi:hypothetical protein
MIVSMHVASGAALGAAVRSRPAAIGIGFCLHFVGDVIRHQDISSRRFEIWSGVAGVLALAGRRGLLDSATLGALASSAPDIEHVVRLPRPGGRKLFPTHRIPGLHRSGGISARTQLLVAGALLGAVLALPRR